MGARLSWLLLIFVIAFCAQELAEGGSQRRKRRRAKATPKKVEAPPPPEPWEKLVADVKARNRFLKKVQDYEQECSAQFRAGIGNSREDQIGAEPSSEHEKATWHILHMCTVKDSRFDQQCTDDTLVFALHTLSLMSLRNAKHGVCCRTEAVYALRRVKWLRKSAIEGPAALDLRLAEVLHSLAAGVAKSKAATGSNVKMVRASDRNGKWQAMLDSAVTAAKSVFCSGEVDEEWVFKEVIDPRLDIESLRQKRIRNGGWVHMSSFLRKPFADRLHRHVDSIARDDWHQSTWHFISGELAEVGLNPSTGPRNTPWMRSLSGQLQQEYNIADKAGRNGHFAYSHLRTCGGSLSCPATRQTKQRCPCTPPSWLEKPVENVTLCDLEAAMGSRSFRRVVANIMGLPSLGGKFQDFMATWYRKGDFLTNHTDSGMGRQIAFRLSLTPNGIWREEWGGNLVFDESSKVGSRSFPHSDSFNTMLLLDVRTSRTAHHVTNVSQRASDDVKRLAVTGWY